MLVKKLSHGVSRVSRFIIFLGGMIACLMCAKLHAQIISEEIILNPNIRSVQFYKGENPLTYPVLYLDDPRSLTLEFDLLSADVTDFSYELVHCNANWQPSDYMPMEFFDGFNRNYITDFQLSINTRISYIHYRLEIPGNGWFLKSGNYLLKIMNSANENEIALVRRFLVVENELLIQPDIGFSTNVNERAKLQAVNFNIFPRKLPIGDPTRELKVEIMQNFRWDNRKVDVQPLYLHYDRYEYRFDCSKDFKGGNEYRMVDVRNIRQNMGRVLKTAFTEPATTVYIQPDKARTKSPYMTEPDFNGNFVIGLRGAIDSQLEADYIWLTIPFHHEFLIDKEIYLFGKLTDWRVQPDFKLHWQEDAKCYSGQFFLKQGVYDYQYVVQKDDNIDETMLEGSHFETENYYSILVYFRGMSDRADRLVGFRHINYYDE